MKEDKSDFGFVNKFDEETHRSLLHGFQLKKEVEEEPVDAFLRSQRVFFPKKKEGNSTP